MCILDSISSPFRICGQITKKMSYSSVKNWVAIWSPSRKHANLFKMLKCNSFIEFIRALRWKKERKTVTLRICFKIFDLKSFVTMWGTFVLATSNMAASAIALAASSPMAPLFDRSSSTTLDENNGVSLKSLGGVSTVSLQATWADFRGQLLQMTSLVSYCMACTYVTLQLVEMTESYTIIPCTISRTKDHLITCPYIRKTCELLWYFQIWSKLLQMGPWFLYSDASQLVIVLI